MPDGKLLGRSASSALSSGRMVQVFEMLAHICLPGRPRLVCITGKSNLMDAISFVVGLQSKELRGKQLKDLIYRST